jgi:hypothetical protein
MHNRKNSETFDLFNNSNNYSIKLKKYFHVYDELFSIYKDKEITFVEIGVLDGGSLQIWKNFFGPKSRIIGIDLNPECKKFECDDFEIFIGSQSDSNFWNSFYKKVGPIDLLLDDGGHTNDQQIITLINSINNINENGLIVIEDTHCSYLKNFGNPSNFSFISFAKKIIDDVNFTYPGIGNFKYSLNKHIYSTHFYESIVAFKINKHLCKLNRLVKNSGTISNNLDVTHGEKIIELRKKYNFLFKFRFIQKIDRIFMRIINIINSAKLKKYFR